MIFAGEEATATITAYANTKWKDAFCSINPPKYMMPVTIMHWDFYLMREDKIRYNWMLIDVVDLMRQAGHQVLPKVWYNNFEKKNFQLISYLKLFSLHYEKDFTNLQKQWMVFQLPSPDLQVKKIRKLLVKSFTKL